MPLFETVTDLPAEADVLARRRFGLIEIESGRLLRVRLRPWPKLPSVPGILLFGNLRHRHGSGDRVWLYYNQPLRFSNFLALKYIVSTRDATLSSLRRGLDVLDEIARLKRSDAILCDVANWRISTRMMQREGFQPHCPSRWHRHYIKRFYGQYPPAAANLFG